MTYQVLARKWRPRDFQSLVGQDHVRQALVNALEQQRLHHAYLFTGTRGVGKTTIARILARCFNCETGVTACPCGECNACREITEGRFIDLIEVDAASKTKVEDTRDLLENVQYLPSRGRYKIYIIDEVHMLSGHSFNALLKTLEEPPAHVKFLLATTDPQRLPVTVLSRCLQFHLKNLIPETIVNYLKTVLSAEKIEYDVAALGLLAKSAEGSMRDALSLLDQAIAFAGGNMVSTQAVQQMLGCVARHDVIPILQAIIDQTPADLFSRINDLANQGAHFANVLEELLELLHNVAVTQALPDASEWEESATVEILAKKLSREDVQLYYQIALIGRRDLPLAPSPKSGFEMVMLRMMAFFPSEKPQVKSVAPATVTTLSAPVVQLSNQQDWPQIIAGMQLTGPVLALAQQCVMRQMQNNNLHLLLDPKQSALLNPKQEERLGEALSKYFKQNIKLKIEIASEVITTPASVNRQQEEHRQQQAQKVIHKDPGVQAIMQTFDAKIHRILPDPVQ